MIDDELYCPNCEHSEFAITQTSDGSIYAATCAYCSEQYPEWPIGVGYDVERAIAEYVVAAYTGMLGQLVWVVDPEKPPREILPS
jgi:hypothetical protein